MTNPPGRLDLHALDQYRAVVETSADGFWMVDLQGRLLDVNQAYQRLSGYSRDELLTMRISDLDASECDEEIASRIERLRNNGTDLFETVHRTKDGTLWPVEISTSYWSRDGGCIFVFLRDLKRRKLSERNYRLLMDNSSDWIACYDQTSRILFASEACRQLIGFEPDELIGTIGLGLVHPDDRERIVQAMHRLFTTRTEQTEQYRALCRSGNYIWVETKGRLLEGSWDGEPALVGITRDISRHKALEEQNLRASQLASVGELAAGVAHEINNPITGIINYAQLLLNGGELKIPREEVLARIIREGDRIAGIVKALLHLSRDTRGDMVMARIEELVGNVMSLVSTQFAKDWITVNLSLPERLPELLVNPQQIEQALINLLHNARYALNEKFREQPAHKRLDIDVALDRNPSGERICRLTVFDNGTGIPPEILPKVTNPFVTTKPAGVGTGLGLSLCQEIVNRHNGVLLIESEWKAFTRVTMELPMPK